MGQSNSNSAPKKLKLTSSDETVLKMLHQNFNSLLSLRNGCGLRHRETKFTSEKSKLNAKLELDQFYDVDLLELLNISFGFGFLIMEVCFENNSQLDVFNKFKIISKLKNLPPQLFAIKEFNLKTRMYISNEHDELARYRIFSEDELNPVVTSCDIFGVQDLAIEILQNLVGSLPSPLIVMVYQYWVGILKKYEYVNVKPIYYDPIKQQIIQPEDTVIETTPGLREHYNAHGLRDGLRHLIV